MGFDYNKHKGGHGGGDSMWTSYSDLFLGLSIIFLLLYVSASLRQGTDGIQQQIELKQVSKENEDLKKQIQAYETLKSDYMAKQASADESENYKELMDKLSLLQDEAQNERQDLLKQASENQKKEKALNQYQQMIRNIVNSNMISKARIKTRDTLIDTKEQVIDEKTGEIKDLQQDVAQKESEIRQGEQKAATLESQLDKRMKQLRDSYKAQNITKKKFEQQKAKLQEEMEGKISQVREATARKQAELEQAEQALAQTNSALSQTKGALAQTEGQLNQAKGSIQALGQEKEKLKGDLNAAAGKHAAEMDAIREGFAKQQAAEKDAFSRALANEKLSGDAKAAKERAFAAAAEGKAKALEGKIGDLDKQFQATKGELATAQENLNAKKKLADKIGKAFAARGIKAEVDGKNGDVMLSFGDQYFDTGRAELKPQMRDILQKAVPAYSASLFEDPKIAQKIQSVEIVGFASPTYKGKFINPKSLDPGDRAAVNFNLDLSYNRARSIFDYVFDKNKMSFTHQKQLLPLVKVTGRSFLSNDDQRNPAGTGSAEEFCRKNDCAKLQRVIIKFTLKD
ncbi:MAG: microtubule-binding protein [Proteobacteria bacterium]|nr:MAG: microtubule-binding protein [Pseudomonadota bacterium]